MSGPRRNAASKDTDFEGEVLLEATAQPTVIGEPRTLLFKITNTKGDELPSSRLVVKRTLLYFQGVTMAPPVEANGGTVEFEMVIPAASSTQGPNASFLSSKIHVKYGDVIYEFPESLTTFAQGSLKSRRAGFRPRVGLFGPMGAGKTALGNALIAMATKPGAAHATCGAVGGSGGTAKSLTQSLSTMEAPGFYLADIYGVTEDTHNWKDQHVQLFKDGLLFEGMSEAEVADLNGTGVEELRKASSRSRMDAAMFVVPASYAADTATGTPMMAKCIATLGALKDIAPVLVVTQSDRSHGITMQDLLDDLDEQNAGEEDSATRTVSPGAQKVADLRTAMAEMFGVEPKRVFIVLNYTKELTRNFDQDLLMYRAMEAALSFADERLEQEEHREKRRSTTIATAAVPAAVAVKK